MGQVPTLWRFGRLLVEVTGNAELGPEAFAQSMGRRLAILHRHPGNRHERTDVGRPHARVLPLVLGHVDELCGLLDQAESRFHNGLRRPDKRDDRSVGRCPGIHVEKANAFYGFHHGGDGVNLGTVAALADVGHAFDEAGVHGVEIVPPNYTRFSRRRSPTGRAIPTNRAPRFGRPHSGRWRSPPCNFHRPRSPQDRSWTP